MSGKVLLVQSAICLLEQAITKNPQSVNAYVEIIYLLHTILWNDDYDTQILTHEYLANLLKHYFHLSYQLFSENAEYLFFIGRIMHVGEWYFEQNDTGLALEMQKKSATKEPMNVLYNWSYISSVLPASSNQQKIIQLTCLAYTSYEILEWLKTKGFAGENVLDALEASYIHYYEDEWLLGKTFSSIEEHLQTVIFFREKQNGNIQSSHLVYLPDDYSLITQPCLPESNFCVMINRLSLTIDKHHRIIDLGGVFGHLGCWIKKKLLVPPYVPGELKIIGNLKSGYSYRYSEDAYGQEEWPVYIDQETGWLCVGDPEQTGSEAVEFINNCVAVVNHSHLKALWLRPRIN